MKVYIPSHLKNLKIIDQLDKMIRGYSKYYEGTYNSFDDYYYSLKNDPVKRFLNVCIPENSVREGQTHEDIINYLSRLFYSVKGTIKVFDYMKSFLNLKFVGDIVYTTRYIKFSLENISLADENSFYESLEDFLSALLYFQELRVDIGTINLILTGNINNYVGTNLNSYNKFSADIYEGDY